MMRYMMLIHHDEAALAAAPQQQLWQDYAAFNEALTKANGESGIRLEPSSKATTVRMRMDNTEVLDGHHIDAKEQLAGYFFVDAETPEDAVAWAKRCPSSRYGSIEIRPVYIPPAGGWK